MVEPGHSSTFSQTTVKFLNFQTPENFAVIYLKLKKRPNLRVFHQKDANGIANSETLSRLLLLLIKILLLIKLYPLGAV